jgi:hypothetical protein
MFNHTPAKLDNSTTIPSISGDLSGLNLNQTSSDDIATETKISSAPHVKFNETFFRSSLWLLFSLQDLFVIQESENFQNPEENEPGYIKSILTAYQLAIGQNGLTIGFIQALQKALHSHILQQDLQADKLENSCQSYVFELGNDFLEKNNFQPELDSTPLATTEGFWEFFNYWLVKTPKSFHNIHFKHKAPTQYSINLNLHQTRDGNVLLLKQNALTGMIPAGEPPCNYDPKSHKEYIESFLVDDDYTCHINSGMPDLVKMLNGSESLISLKIKMITKICQKYNTEISRVISREQKLELIVSTSQKLSQLILFKSDINSRLFVVILNTLLNQNGFPFTVLALPTRLKTFSIAQIVEQVIAGQNNFLLLCKGIFPSFSDKYTFFPDYTPHLKTVVPLDIPEPLINAFVKICQDNITRSNIDLTHINEATPVSKLYIDPIIKQKTILRRLKDALKIPFAWSIVDGRAIMKGKLITASNPTELATKGKWFKDKFKAAGIDEDLICFEPTEEGATKYRIVVNNIDTLLNNQPMSEKKLERNNISIK